MKNVPPLLVLFALVLSGCYHATVVTGLEPSNQVIEENFAASWIYGLVPPKTVETMAECPNGVASVKTQLSFVNQLIGALSFGIFTPMTIEVTCAAGDGASAEIQVQEGADVVEAFSRAADVAAERGGAVVVEFE